MPSKENQQNYTSKHYFIQQFSRLVRNDNKILSKNCTASIQEILIDYTSLHEDYTSSINNIKLKYSISNYIEALQYYLKNCYLGTHERLSKDFVLLINEIDKFLKHKNETEFNLYSNKINIISKSLIKKCSTLNLVDFCIESVKKEKQFSNVDKAIKFLLGELFYYGYSIEYITDWLKHDIYTIKFNNGNIDNALDKFKFFSKKKIDYKYIINVVDIGLNTDSTIYINENVKLEKIESKSNLTTIFDEKELGFLQESKDYIIFSSDINASDVNKGLDILLDGIQNYMQLHMYVSSSDLTKIYLDKVLAISSDKKVYKLVSANKTNSILFSKIEQREKLDIEDFLIYRDMHLSQKKNYEESINIQRSLNIITNQHNQQMDSRLLNLWSVLEYSLTFHNGNSIIAKVLDVVPKIMCLYYIKDKINLFWSRLLAHKNHDIDIVKEIFEHCSEGDYTQYKLDLFIDFLETKNKTLIDLFSFDVLLQRDIALIGMLLTNKENREKHIANYYDEVKYDLIRIYRTRNQLIHSGKFPNTNIDMKSLRLFQYNSSLLGVIIYYKNKNNDTEISEILNSVVCTFDEYKTNVLVTSDKMEISKPNYLYL